MRTGIYAILDTVADMIVGGLHLHKHDAAAIRMFTDIASSDGTTINRHPEDFVLVQLGTVIEYEPHEPRRIESDYHTVLTGKQYLAVSQPPIGERHPAPAGQQPSPDGAAPPVLPLRSPSVAGR